MEDKGKVQIKKQICKQDVSDSLEKEHLLNAAQDVILECAWLYILWSCVASCLQKNKEKNDSFRSVMAVWWFYQPQFTVLVSGQW